MTDLQSMLSHVQNYVNQSNWRRNLAAASGPWVVTPLAQGEYNLNFLLTSRDAKLVLRVNIGTQIGRKDQIVYEFKALKLLTPSRVTPRAWFVDDSRRHIDHGVLIMQYLPGAMLDYRQDCPAAARVLAQIHQTVVDPADNHLIVENTPLTLIFEESSRLLQTYLESDLADPNIRDYLKDVLQWADEARAAEKFYQQDPWPCIVNTEVNAGNFIVDRPAQKAYLIDWEMPRWGDPSQDVAHFCSPLTTLWKTRYQMSTADRQAFVAAYQAHLHDRHLIDTLHERIDLRDPFVRLRGISWSAMGWVAYQTDFDGIKNADTWQTLQRYMDYRFIRSVFNPWLH